MTGHELRAARYRAEDRERAVDRVLAGVRARALRVAELRDEAGWPEPRTVAELRRDPRAMLRNTIPHDDDAENLELAAALMVLVATDRPAGARGQRLEAPPMLPLADVERWLAEQHGTASLPRFRRRFGIPDPEGGPA